MSIPSVDGLAEALFEEAGDALFLIDPDNDQVLCANPTAEHLTQLTRQQLMSQPVTYWFRFGGKGGRQRLHEAVSHSHVFHAQDGFLLRTAQDGLWVPVNLTISRLHVQPHTLALITARDAREQLETQARLSESHRLLQAITEGTADAIFIKDLHGRYLMINPAGARLMGKTVQDVLGKDDAQLLEPETARLMREHDRQVLASGQTQTFEEMGTFDGLHRTFHSTKGPYRDAEGNVIGLVCIARDVSDRKKAEEELIRERYLLGSLMDNIPDTIYFKDRDSRFVRVNWAWARHSGWPGPDAALGKTDFDFFTEEHARQAFEDEQEIIRTGQPLIGQEEKETWPDGHVTWVSTTKMPLRDADGNIIGTFGMSRDITARKQAQEAMRKAEERWRLLLECSGEGIYGIDQQGGCTFINRAAAQMLGYTPEEVLGRNMHQLCHHSRPDGSPYPVEQCPIFRSIHRGEGCRMDNEVFWRRNGTSFPAAYSSYPLRGDGQAIIGAVINFTDVTDRRRAEVELQKAKAVAEAASRAKSEFLANMSHEIRTPMNGILGMTELALETSLTEQQREYLHLVKISAESLLSVINDILDFSKIEAGKLQLDPVPFYLRDSLGDTMKTLALRAQQKGLELAYHVQPDVPDNLVGDALRLRQVLVNLIGNAIKFTQSGEVVVSVRRATTEDRKEVITTEHTEYTEKREKTESREKAEGPENKAQGASASSASSSSSDSSLSSSVYSVCSVVNLHFEVSDTGIGIPPDKQERIFEAFAQADSSTTRQYGGTGLGLTISSRLVERMGGRIWVESPAPSGGLPAAASQGPGSCFHFTAELGLHEGIPSKPHPVHPASLRGMNVLVVDDNATNRYILHEILCSWNMKPTTVELAQQALAELKRAAAAGSPYPLMLLDAMMPQMDGLALAEEVRRHRELDSTAMLLLSSAGRPDDVGRCRQLGIKACLTKPVKQSELLDAIVGSLSEAGPTLHPTTPEPAPTPSLRRRLRVLLAEDNAVNQTLATILLEKEGHQVVLASTGNQALEALEREAFDLVLMDVQMPEMDGLEATQRVRSLEQGTGRHIPIIALTAHAMKGDRERCLAAGADGYVSKPLQPHELYQAIKEVVPASGGEELPPTSVSAATSNEREGPSEPVFDRAEAMSRVGGDETILQELAGMFLEECPRWVAAMRQAIHDGDSKALQRAAHTLKGAVGIFAARSALEAAQHLETLARQGDLSQAEEAFQVLQEALARLEPALQELLADVASRSS